jgi:hypothetical protein
MKTYPCPHCGSSFGDQTWRDNHAYVCALATKVENMPRQQRARSSHALAAPMPMATAAPEPLNLYDALIASVGYPREYWMREAIESRKRNGVPDWTRGLLPRWPTGERC